MYDRPITTRVRFMVKNAYMGEERFDDFVDAPWTTMVSPDILAEAKPLLHRHGYFKVRTRPERYAEEWARFPLWLHLWAQARWRDLRLGRDPERR